MIRNKFLLLCSLFLHLPLNAQTPTVTPPNAEDKLRNDVAQTHKAFLVAYPDLERNLTKAPPAVLRQQVVESRQLAVANSHAKAELYDYLVRQARAEMARVAGEGKQDLSTVNKDRETAIARRKATEQDASNATALADQYRRRLAAASGAEAKRLELDVKMAEEQAAALQAIRNLVQDEINDLENVRNGLVRTETANKQLLELKNRELKSLQDLKAAAERGGVQYKNYFDALETFVDSRDPSVKRDAKQKK